MFQDSQKPDWSALLFQALTEPGKLSEAYRVFRGYSLGNQFLAAIQLAVRGLPLSPIASFAKWKELGRSVKKGERAIQLVMPVTIKRKAEGEDGEESKGGFTVFTLKKHWFSLDQTDGAEYSPEVTTHGWDKAQALSNLGVEQVRFEFMDGNVQGYSVPGAKQIAISPVAAMPWKTTFHELAHCLLHGNEAVLADGELMPKCIKEAEAEATAYLCCASLGLPGMDESRGYIQSWLDGNDFPDKSARRVFTAADKILKAGAQASAD